MTGKVVINTILFDLYGTLLRLSVDSKPFITLARRAKPEDFRKCLQLSLTCHIETLAVYAMLLGLPPQDDIDDLEAGLKRDIDSAVLFADTLPALQAVKNRGIRTVLVSNVATPYKRAFSDHQLERYFNAVVFSCDTGMAKPDPAMYRYAMTQVGANARETIMVGDSERSDVRGPADAGVRGYLLDRKRENSGLATLRDIPSLL